MKLTKVELDIEELILRDVPYALRHQIAAAVEQELARLLSEQGLPPSLEQGGSIPDIAIGPVQIAGDARADAIGFQVARSVYGKLWANQQPD